MAPVAKVELNASYSIEVKNLAVSGAEKGASIRLDGLRFNMRLPVIMPGGGTHYSESGISTDIDIREGQKVVVGKSSIDSGSQSIFLVVTAKVVD